VIARSHKRLEGFIRMNLNGAPPASLAFMAVAPWNIRSINDIPGNPELSMDLMRLSMIISLYAAKQKPGHYPAMDCVFVSYRGVGFARKFFGIQEDDMQKIGILINKTGLEAYLEGNINRFRSNFRIFAAQFDLSTPEIDRLLVDVGEEIRAHYQK
jgi:hypothetical protein